MKKREKKFQFLIILASIIVSTITVFAQSGCTDPAATNYFPPASTNNGSCVYATTHGTATLRAAFPTSLHESSGCVFTIDGKMWTHNDSGNSADIYSVDTTNGSILQTVSITNYPNTDWEDITADSNYIYIDDAGNNNGDRTDLKILKIARSSIGSGTTVSVTAQAISFSYADQTSFVSSSTNNYDCESLISIGSNLYIFTKDRGDGQTRVYKLPKTPGTYSVSPLTSYNVGGLVSGACYNASLNEVLLIGYSMSGHTNSFIWILNSFTGDSFFSGNKRKIEIGNNNAWQTEGICYRTNNHLFITNETAGSISASEFTFELTPYRVSRPANTMLNICTCH